MFVWLLLSSHVTFRRLPQQQQNDSSLERANVMTELVGVKSRQQYTWHAVTRQAILYTIRTSTQEILGFPFARQVVNLKLLIKKKWHGFLETKRILDRPNRVDDCVVFLDYE